jgi:hypothetical protein
VRTRRQIVNGLTKLLEAAGSSKNKVEEEVA